MQVLKRRIIRQIMLRFNDLRLHGAFDIAPSDSRLVVTNRLLSVEYRHGNYCFFNVTGKGVGANITLPSMSTDQDIKDLLRCTMRRLRVLLSGIELMLATLPKIEIEQVNQGHLARHYAGACKLNANATMGAHGEGKVSASGYLDEIRKRTKHKEHLKHCCDYISAYRKGYYATWVVPSET